MSKEQILVLLKSFKVFEGVPEKQLQWFIDNSELKKFNDGEAIFKPGDPIDKILVILEGGFKIFIHSDKQERELAVKIKGEISGFLPFSRAKEATGTSRVIGNATILCLNKSFEKEMLIDHYELSQVLVHEMTSRVREFTGFQMQTEKMAALGKLSAGLAHELNNPVSAIARSAQELKKHLSLQPEKFKKVIKTEIPELLINHLSDLLITKIENLKSPKSLLQLKNLEDDLFILLEELNVDNAMELAENLAEFGIDESDINLITNQVRKEDIGAILSWMGDNLVMEKMVNDIHVSSERISKLVSSVKIYTHMDQAQELTKVDLHDGIRNTLNILNYKIKAQRVEIRLEFDQKLPPIPLFISEINQVWTNLLDNAVDAVAEVKEPNIIIQTRQLENQVQICIIDNGKGIPKEIASRIWEPFFTTKEIGKGTGLGLELVKNIVEKHRGTIKMRSQPGNTTFELNLPVI